MMSPNTKKHKNIWFQANNFDAGKRPPSRAMDTDMTRPGVTSQWQISKQAVTRLDYRWWKKSQTTTWDGTKTL